MKNIFILFLYLIGFTSFSYSQKAPERVRGHILVQLKANVSPKEVMESLQNFQQPTTLHHQRCLHPGANLHLLTFDENAIDAQNMLAILHRSPLVLHAQFDHLMQDRAVNPDDKRYNEQWALRKIQAPNAWETTTGGRSFNGDTIVVAVMDGGCQLDHEDLQENIWRNHAETPNDDLDNDGNGYIDDYYGLNIASQSDLHEMHPHGTRVAGIIGAKGDNGIGVAGINWDVKLLILSEVRSEAQVVEAMMYCYDLRKKYNATNGQQGAFVVAANYSLGIDGGDCVDSFPMWNPALDSLGSVGILMVGATADQNWDVDEVGDIPTTCTSDFMIGVTNTDQMDNKVIGAAYGAKSVDLGAPGNGTITTSPGDMYFEDFAGTSAAAPHVAGSIGLMYSYPCQGLADDALRRPRETALLMKEFLLGGVDIVESMTGRTVSNGRLNLNNSIMLLEAHYGQTRGPLGFVALKPNPVDEQLILTVALPDFEDYQLRVYNSIGQRVLTDQIPGRCTSPEIPLDVQYLTPGVYFIVIENPDNFATAKFMVK